MGLVCGSHISGITITWEPVRSKNFCAPLKMHSETDNAAQSLCFSTHQVILPHLKFENNSTLNRVLCRLLMAPVNYLIRNMCKRSSKIYVSIYASPLA